MAINRYRVQSSPTPSFVGVYYQTRPYYGTTWNNEEPTFLAPGPDYWYRSINDESGKYTPGIVRPCESLHTIVKYDSVFPPTPRVGIYLSRCDPISFRFNDPCLSIGHRDFSVDATRFVDSVARNIKQEIPSQVSLPNFLLELRDIPSTLKTIASLRALSPKNGSVRNLVKKIKSGKIKLAENVSDHWLNYQFGIKPLISDLFAFVGTSDYVAKRLSELRKTRNQDIRFRNKHTFFSEVVTPWGSTPMGYYKWGPIRSSYVSRLRHTVTAGGVVHNALTNLDDIDAQWNANLAALGFNKPLSVIWEAIPFSFLADYVSNIGSILESFSTPVFDGSITVKQGWTTNKREYETQLFVSFWDPSIDGWSPEQSAGIAQSTYFSRTVGLATSRGLLIDTNQSWNQIANTLALLA